MSVKLVKLISLITGNKDNAIGKVGKGVVITIISPFVAIIVLIGAIFSDGINFNQNIVTDLFEGNPIAEFQGEQAQFINDVQHELLLIDTKMNETNQTFTNGATLNAYQVKGYFIGFMFSKQKMEFDENKAERWIKSFTVESKENEVKKIVPTSVNSAIYSHLESNLSIILNDDTKEAMERVYGGLIGNNGGTVTTLSKEEMDKLLNHLPEETSELRKNIVLQAGDAVGKIPYYWGGAANCAGYEGNHFGTACFTRL